MEAEGQRSSRSILESLESRRLFANVGYAEIDFRMTGLVAHPTRNEVYLVGNDRKVRVVNTDSGNETRQITLPVVPGRAAVSPDGSILLVALPETKQVQVISLSTYTTTNVLDVGRPLIDVAVGVGNRFYGAWGTGSSIINQYDLSSGAKTAEVFSYAKPSPTLTIDSTGKWLYFNDDLTSSSVVREFDVSNPDAVKERRIYSGSAQYPLPDVPGDRIFTATRSSAGVRSISRSSYVQSMFWSIGGYDETADAVAGFPNAGSFYVATVGYSSSTIHRVKKSTASTLSADEVYGKISPGAMAVTANGRVAFVSNQFDSSDKETWFGIVGTPGVSLSGSQPVISGEVFNDKNGNFRRDKGEYWFYPSGETAATYRAPQALVYLDKNRDGSFDSDLEFGIEVGWQTQSFRFPVEGPGTYDIRAIPKDDSFVDYDRAIYSTKMATITITEMGQQIANAHLPFSAGFKARGEVFADTNQNGRRETDEPLLSGAVFYDRNNNGFRDRREILVEALTEEDAFYRYEEPGFVLDSPPGGGTLRLLADPNTTFTTPSSKSLPGLGAAEYVVNFGISPALKLTGVVYDDSNGNGRREEGERPREQIRVWLDANYNNRYDKGERSAFSDATGRYTITHSTLNTDLRVVMRSGLSKPLFYTRTPKYVFFDQWNQTLNVDYGLYPATTIKVNVFRDRDQSGSWSSGDTWLDGIDLYVDRDRDGQRDGDEKTFTSDDGIVSIGDLVAGEYAIAWITEPGRVPSTPLPLKVKIRAGETKTVWIAFRS